MNSIIYKKTNKQTQDAIDNLRGDIARRTEEYKLRNAYAYKYPMNDEEHESFQRLFKRRYVKQNATIAWRTNDHPVLANLNEYAYDEMRTLSDEARKAGLKTIEIGANVARKQMTDHQCILIKSNRDCHRYANNTLYSKEKNKELIYNYATSSCMAPLACVLGAEHCDYKADIAIAINSLYDITFEKLMSIFHVHELKIMHAWMYLPLSLLDKDFAHIEDNWSKMTFEGEYAYFALKDYSFVYKHKYSEWRKWLKYTVIHGPHFNLVIETTETFGNFHHITITHIKHAEDIICRNIPIGDVLYKYNRIKNLFQYYESNCTKRLEELDYLYIPKEICMAMSAYSSRQLDDKYHWTGFATFLYAKIKGVRIGPVVVYEDFIVGAERFAQICFTLFVYGAFKRAERTHGIRNIFNFLRDFCQPGVINSVTRHIRTAFYSKVEDVKDVLFNNIKSTDTNERKNESKNLVHCEIEEIPDDIINGFYDLKEYEYNIKHFNLPSSKSSYTPRTKTDVKVAPTIDDASTIISSYESGTIPTTVTSDTLSVSTNSESIVTTNEVDDITTISSTEGDTITDTSTNTVLPIKPGHCAIVAFAGGLQLIGMNVSSEDVLNNLYIAIKNHHLHRDYNNKEIKDLIKYVYDGRWNAEVINEIMVMLCFLYDKHITIKTPEYQIHIDTIHADKHIDFVVELSNDHFILSGKGGVKFENYDMSVMEIDVRDDEFVKKFNGDYTICLYPGVELPSLIMKQIKKRDKRLVKCISVKDLEQTLEQTQHKRVDIIITRSYIDIRSIIDKFLTDEGYAYVPLDCKFDISAYDTCAVNDMLRLKKKKDIKTIQMQTTVMRFEKFAESIQDIVKIKRYDGNSYEFQYLFGVAGAEKTKRFVEEFGKIAIFVTPTVVLADGLKMRGCNEVYTQHVALTKCKDRIVIIDEAPRLSLEHLIAFYVQGAKQVILLGDVYQIGFIDYAHADLTNFVKFYDLKNQLNVSRRIPRDVARLLRYMGYDIQTTSKIENSIYISKNAPKRMENMTFNQVSKDHYTIDNLQGATFESIAFNIDDKAIETNVYDRPEHIYTAFTRHTNKIVCYGNTDKIEQMLQTYKMTFQIYEEISGVYPTDDTTLIPDALPVEMQEIVENINVDKSKVTVTMIKDILLERLPAINQQYHLVSHVQPADLPPVSQGKAILDPNDILPIETTQKGFKIDRDLTCVRNYFSNNKRMTIDTLCGRYAKSSRIHGHEESLNIAREMLCNLSKFLGFKKIDDFKKYMRPKAGELDFHLKEYYRSLNMKLKGDDKESKRSIQELEEWKELVEEDIKFFMKKQPKFDAKDFDTKYKFGQGVSASSKRVNCIFAAFTRFIMHRIARCNPKIIFSTGMPDHEIGSYIANLIQEAVKLKGAEYYKATDNDYSEWDTHYVLFLILHDALIFEIVGMSEAMVNYYVASMTDWKMVYTGSNKLFGKYKQKSGHANTLNGNSIGNLSLTVFIIDFNEILFILFKGDDIHAWSNGAKYNHNYERIMRISNHQMKLQTSYCGEFAGDLVTPYGLYPDLLRKVTRFMCKYYHDEKHFEDAKDGLEHSLMNIKSRISHNTGTAYLQEHYKHLGITEGECDMLLSFALDVKNVTFKQLHSVNMPVLIV